MNNYYLKDLIQINNGRDYRQLQSGNIPVYGSSGLMTYVNDYLHDGEAILLPRKGTLNNIMYVTGKFWTVDTMYWATVNAQVAYPKYLYLYLSLLDLSAKDSGSTLPSMTYDSYYSVPIKLPNLIDQKNVADKVFSIINKIEKNDAISSQLESLAKTIYDYWFLQFDFPDENGRPYKSSGGKMVWNEELKREIPEGWKAISLGSLFTITMGSSPKGGSLNENKEGVEFYQGSTDFGTVYPAQRVFTTAPIRKAVSQDVLLSVRAPVGDMNIAMNDCCIGRGLAAVHHESALFAWNTLQTLQPYFDVYNNNGTTFGALTADLLKEQLVPNIPHSLVKKYISSIHDAEQAIRNIELENRQLSSLRDFLLPMLMNGQVTFKEDA